jgi:hypothetical protein
MLSNLFMRCGLTKSKKTRVKSSLIEYFLFKNDVQNFVNIDATCFLCVKDCLELTVQIVTV